MNNLSLEESVNLAKKVKNWTSIKTNIKLCSIKYKSSFQELDLELIYPILPEFPFKLSIFYKEIQISDFSMNGGEDKKGLLEKLHEIAEKQVSIKKEEGTKYARSLLK